MTVCRSPDHPATQSRPPRKPWSSASPPRPCPPGHLSVVGANTVPFIIYSLMVGVGPAAKQAIFLSAWTAHGHIGTVLTAIPGVRTKHPPAIRALIKEATGIGGHRAFFPSAAEWAGQGRMQENVHQTCKIQVSANRIDSRSEAIDQQPAREQNLRPHSREP